MKSFYLLLLLYWHPVFGFDCQDINQESQCIQLKSEGCSWENGLCSGTFFPACMPPQCYYIDSSGGTVTDIATKGSPTNPLKSFNPEGQEIYSKDADIIVINHKENTIIMLDVYITISSAKTTFRPLFSENRYIVKFTEQLVSISEDDETNFRRGIIFVKSENIKLTVKGAIFTCDVIVRNQIFSTEGLYFVLENVDFRNLTNTADWYYGFIYSGYGDFNYTGGEIFNVSSLSYFYFAGISAIVKDVRIIDLNTTEAVFLSEYAEYMTDNIGTMTFENIYATGGSFLFAQCWGNICKIHMNNILFEKTNATLFSSFYIVPVFDIKNAMFRDLSPFHSPEYAFTFIKIIEGENIVFENITFYNITLRHSILHLEGKQGKFLMDRVRMEDLKQEYFDSLTSLDIEYLDEWQGGLCSLVQKDTLVNITNSIFINIDGFCLGLKNSLLVVTSSTFDNSALEVKDNSISKDQENSLEDNSGGTWINIKDPIALESGNPPVLIEGNKFIKNNKPAKYGGAISLRGKENAKVQIISNEFIENIAFYGGAIYCDNDLIQLSSTGNLFQNNIAVDGGAIYKKSSGFIYKPLSPSMLISEDKYIGNIAMRSGGALYLNWESLGIEKTEFFGNTAQNGGAVNFLNLDNNILLLKSQAEANGDNKNGHLSAVKFTSNTAHKLGGAMRLNFDYSNLNEDTSNPVIFQNNNDLENKTINNRMAAYYLFSFYDIIVEKVFEGTENIKKATENSQQTRLVHTINTSETYDNSWKLEHKSGSTISQIIKIEVIDDQHNIADFVNDEQISIKLFASQDITASLMAPHLTFPFKNGQIFISDEIILTGEEDSTTNINFQGVYSTFEMLKDSNTLMDVSISVRFVKCKMGDIFNSKTRVCESCDPQTYSLADPYQASSCHECIPNAMCFGGAKLAPAPGYWRSAINSDKIHKCPRDEACLGGLVEDVYFAQGLCSFPHKGVLCDICEDNYAKFGASKSCVDCQENVGYYLKLICFFLLKSTAIYSIVRYNLTQNSKALTGVSKDNLKRQIENENFRYFVLKITVSFVQMSSFIVDYQYGWPDLIVDFVGITNYFMPTGKDGFAIDCILSVVAGSNHHINFIRLIVVLLQPFVLFGIGLSIYFIFRNLKGETFKKSYSIWDFMNALAKSIIFILQPHIIQVTLELFRCQSLEMEQDTKDFMIDNPEIECWTGLHLGWAIGVGLSFFLIWGVVLPLLRLREVRSIVKGFSKNDKLHKEFSFVLQGLRSNGLYWEFAILGLKIFILITYTFFNMINTPRDLSFMVFAALLLFGVIHIKLEPYIDHRLNHLELFSVVNLLFMAFLDMFFLADEKSTFTEVLFKVILLALNVCFYILMVYYLITSYIPSLQRNKSKNLFVKVPSIKKSLSIKETPSESKDVEKILQKISLKPEEQDIDYTNPNQLKESVKLFMSEESGIPSEIDLQSPTFKTNYKGETSKIDNFSVIRNSEFSRFRTLASPHSDPDRNTQAFFSPNEEAAASHPLESPARFSGRDILSGEDKSHLKQLNMLSRFKSRHFVSKEEVKSTDNFQVGNISSRDIMDFHLNHSDISPSGEKFISRKESKFKGPKGTSIAE